MGIHLPPPAVVEFPEKKGNKKSKPGAVARQSTADGTAAEFPKKRCSAMLRSMEKPEHRRIHANDASANAAFKFSASSLALCTACLDKFGPERKWC